MDKAENSVYVDVLDIKGARLGFFKHNSLGKMVRIGENSMEICSPEFLRCSNMRSVQHYRWPEHKRNYDNIILILGCTKDYDPDKKYQCFNI